ncbi:MAG: NifU N-terminal domain-containing protein [Actinobacteria bacterium]|nr:NifU N-terminal domain-containing protein [Actinomycetota bacterium]
MGQEITVTALHGASPSVMLFDLNRSLTGMAIERYPSAADARGDRPPDVLARRLFALGATRVTVYSSVVTVEAPPDRWEELQPEITSAIEHLFLYYGDDAGWSPEALGQGVPAGNADGAVDGATDGVSDGAASTPAEPAGS